MALSAQIAHHAHRTLHHDNLLGLAATDDDVQTALHLGLSDTAEGVDAVSLEVSVPDISNAVGHRTLPARVVALGSKRQRPATDRIPATAEDLLSL